MIADEMVMDPTDVAVWPATIAAIALLVVVCGGTRIQERTGSRSHT